MKQRQMISVARMASAARGRLTYSAAAAARAARPRTDRIAYAEKRLEAMRAETRSERASAIARGAAAENAIAVLLGETPGSLESALASITNVPSVSEQSLSDIPLETMRARPDVLKADRELAEKIAKVGGLCTK